MEDLNVYFEMNKEDIKMKWFSKYVLDSVGIIQAKEFHGAFGQNLESKKNHVCESFLQLW